MFLEESYLEYSICPQRKDIWSTPDVYIKQHMEHLNLECEKHLKYSRCNQERYIWSTPDVTRNDIYGVLQMSLKEIHLEYSSCHLERHIWNPPDVTKKDIFGVLQMSPRYT